MMKTLRVVLLIALLIALAPAATASAQTTSIRCLSRPAPLTRATTVNGATTCFTVTPARGSTALRLDLAVTNGAYDLYVTAGSVTSLTDSDKVNVSAVSGELSYVLVDPGASPYTVAVVRSGRAGAARLSPEPTYKATLKCSGATCNALYPLTSMPGTKYGDQAIFPVDVTKAGRVEVKVTWRGTARLSALLYGPSVSKTGITQSSLARKDGASPLTLTYNVGSKDLMIRGGKWSVGLSNAGKAGGTITSGQISITYQR